MAGKYKQCRLSEDTHKKLRLLGAEHDLTINQVIERLLKNGIEEAALPRLPAVTHTKQSATPAKRFVPPTVAEVHNHIISKGYSFDAESFVAHYEANGWKVGRNKMRSWKAACVTWAKREAKPGRQYLTAHEKMAQSLRDSRDPVKAMDF